MVTRARDIYNVLAHAHELARGLLGLDGLLRLADGLGRLLVRDALQSVVSCGAKRMHASKSYLNFHVHTIESHTFCVVSPWRT